MDTITTTTSTNSGTTHPLTKGWVRGFDAAKAASVHSDAPKKAKKMGAAIFSGSNIKALGFNTLNTTHPQARFGIHAELKALLKRQYYGDKHCTLYTYRELASGAPGCSRPCPACMQSIRESGIISTVRFVDEQGQFSEIKI